MRVELSGASLSGVKLAGSLDGSELVATAPDGGEISGCQMAGVVLQGAVVDDWGQNQGTIPLTIVAALQDSDPDNTDVWFYDVTYPTGQNESDPLCGTYTDGGDVLAVALSGTWNYGEGYGGGDHIDSNSEFTLACDGDALFKCAVDLGYKPWSTDTNGASLSTFHEACTRTLRADYCGDGTPHTIDGTLIDIYDNVGVQADTDSDWEFEAEWDAAGATCVHHLRIGDASDISCNGRYLPSKDCGDPAHFNTGTLLMDRHNPTDSSSSGSGSSSSSSSSSTSGGGNSNCGSNGDNGGDNGGSGWGSGGTTGGGSGGGSNGGGWGSGGW